MKNLTSLLCFLSLFCLAFPLFAQTESCTDKRYIDEIFEFERLNNPDVYGEAVAVLNRNEPAFYCVPAEAYELLMDRLEDLELLSLAAERENEETISVNIHDL